MKISAVIPTIKGREQLLEQTVNSLRHTTTDYSVELIVVRDSPTIGEAWNEGAESATGTHMWLGADDVTFAEGWLQAVIDAAEEGVYPVPRIVRPDGSIEACGTLGQGALMQVEMADGFQCASSQFPFLKSSDWEYVGPALPIHYYADDHLGVQARYAGLEVKLVRDYTLIHHEGTAGRARMVTRAMSDRDRFIQAIAEEHSCLVAS